MHRGDLATIAFLPLLFHKRPPVTVAYNNYSIDRVSATAKKDYCHTREQ